MVEQTRSLLEMGLAYEKLRSVYFRISSFSDYGRLSGIAPERMRSEVSTTYDYYDKDNPGDFALFKRSTLAELKSGIFWQTPWGNARPGWHMECACMAVRYLGQPIDIHTASTDLTFPHGDNEIAIACGLKHKPLAKLWMHSELVMADGKKVSRAGGNDLTLEHLLEQGFDGPTVRYWLLATHYRTVLHYSRRELQRAAQCVARLNEFAARLVRFQSGRRGVEVGPALHEVQAAWRDALDNDLNIPKALGKLFPFVRQINRLLDRDELDGDQVGQILDFMRQTNDVLDVMDFRPEEPNAQVAELIEARRKARQSKDFHTADAIRKELELLGVRVADSPIGTS
jgi:cysteinyl-tRNA synthetase